jgi:hypothetical protein
VYEFEFAAKGDQQGFFGFFALMYGLTIGVSDEELDPHLTCMYIGRGIVHGIVDLKAVPKRGTAQHH